MLPINITSYICGAFKRNEIKISSFIMINLSLTLLLIIISCNNINDININRINYNHNDSTNIVLSKRLNLKKDNISFEKMYGGHGSLKTIKESQSTTYFKLLTPDPIQLNDSIIGLKTLLNDFHYDSILNGPNVIPDSLKDSLIDILMDSNIYDWNDNCYKLCTESREYGIRFVNNNDTIDIGIGAYCANIYIYRNSKYIGYQYLQSYSRLFRLIHYLYPNDVFFDDYFRSEIKFKQSKYLFSKIESLFFNKYVLDKIEYIIKNNDTIALIGYSYSQTNDSAFPKSYLSIINSKINHSWISDVDNNFILHCFNDDMISKISNENGIIEFNLYIDNNFRISNVKVLYNTLNLTICDCMINDLFNLDFSSHAKFNEIKTFLPIKVSHAWALLKKPNH